MALLAIAAPTRAQYAVHGTSAGSALGDPVAVCADLDGDGVSDLVLGAPDSSAGGIDSGEVRVISGADGSLLFAMAGAAPFDDFGAAVSGVGDLDGDGIPDLLVGSPQDYDEGTVVSNWTGYAQILSGVDGTPLQFQAGEQIFEVWGGRFGSAVASPGDVDGDGVADYAVGEFGADLEGVISGAVSPGRLHWYSGADGTEIRQLVGFVDISAAEVGRALASAGDLDGDGVGDLLVSAPYHDQPMGDGEQEGISLVSGATGSIVWTTPQGPMSWLGLHVALGGDLDGDGTPDVLGSERSAVSVFSGTTGALIRKFPTADLISVGGPTAADVGDIDGDGLDDVAVGDPTLSTVFGANTGAVRIYSGANGMQLGEIPGEQSGERFGASLASASGIPGIPGLALVIGAPGHDGPAGVDAGRVRVLKPQGGLTIPHVLTVTGLPPATGFGSAVAIAGDVDNDGWEDISVGAPFDETAGYLSGAVRVFSGRDGELLQEFHGLKLYERLGWSVARLGDVNGDGFADILAAAPFAANPFGPGVVRVWSGRDGSLLRTFTGLSNNDQFGYGIASAGLVDGDAVPDIVVGVPYDDLAGTNKGAVRVFSGASGALLLQVLGDEVNSAFGAAVAGLGDVDGDGASDIAIGVRNDDGTGGTDAGRVLVVSGTSGGVLVDRAGTSSVGMLGWSLAAPGDVDGDGKPDVLAGEPGDDSAGGDAGRALLLSGADGSTLMTVFGVQVGSAAGRTVAALGDLGGDGVQELVVGSPGGARVDVVDGATGEPLFTASTGTTDQFGQAVAGGGDVDNNGSPELAIGVAQAAVFGAPNGAVIVFDLAPQFTPWQSAGAVLPGTFGAPLLEGSGSLLPGTTTTLALSHAKPGASTALVVGFVALNAPFKGGTMVPYPHLVIQGLPISPAGTLNLSAPWPAGLPPGTALWFQHWFADAAALQGLAASNAVKAVTP